MPEGVEPLKEEIAKKMKDAGLTDDEIKVIEAWRYIKWGNLRCFKKDNKLSGRIEINSTY
jgi:hypothetical protein